MTRGNVCSHCICLFHKTEHMPLEAGLRLPNNHTLHFPLCQNVAHESHHTHVIFILPIPKRVKFTPEMQNTDHREKKAISEAQILKGRPYGVVHLDRRLCVYLESSQRRSADNGSYIIQTGQTLKPVQLQTKATK